MILFALIVLPVGAQNETEAATAPDDPTISPPDQSTDQLSSDAASADPLTQIGYEGDSGMDYLYSLSMESTSSDQSDAGGIISEEPINNLENLENSIASTDSGEAETAPQDDTADDVSARGADLEQASSDEELERTMQAIDQSEAGFPPTSDEDISADQVSSHDAGSILNIFGQSDDRILLNDEFSSEGNGVGSGDIAKNMDEMRSEWGANSKKVAAKSNHASRSVLSQGSESQGNGDRAIRDQYSRSLSNLELITKFADGKDVTNQNLEAVLLGMNSQLDVLQNPDPKKADYLTILPYWGPLAAPSDSSFIETSYMADLSTNDEDDKPKNYAVIVGINKYSDRRSLHTSVNDAKKMAEVLREFYGYEVILLTDETKDLPPTKHNILDGALAEIKAKQNRGDVLVYFSGHGEVDDKGNFYLIPKDAKANPSSYISEDELNRYTKGIKRLSLIVDACYSGGLYNKEQRLYGDRQGMGGTGEDQLILSSSREDEPSNEMWNETNSVFTYYLCHAMEYEAKKSSGLPLQTSLESCFESVQDNTIQWSNSHFLTQTPSSIWLKG